jgi:ribosome hibernation promoting factor
MDLASALQSYVERRLVRSLNRFGQKVGRISVRITDVNGPRGGQDKSCQVSAEFLPSGKTLVQQTVDADLYRAIGSTTRGIARSVARALGRNRERRRETVRLPGRRSPESRQAPTNPDGSRNPLQEKNDGYGRSHGKFNPSSALALVDVVDYNFVRVAQGVLPMHDTGKGKLADPTGE